MSRPRRRPGSRGRAVAGWFALLFLGLALAPSSAARSKDRSRGFERVDVRLSGRPLSIEADAGADGTRALLVLVADEVVPAEQPPVDAPCDSHQAAPGTASLWRVVYSGNDPTPSVSRLAEELPAPSGRIVVADADGDGAADRLVLLPGRLVRVDALEGAVRTLLADKNLHPRTSDVVEIDDGLLVSIAGLGDARFVRLAADETVETLVELRIPVEARAGGHAFRLSSPPPRRVRGPLPSPRWSTPPRAEGETRLSGLAIDPTADSPGLEWWAGLPAPEELLDSEFLVIDGRPALMVTTRPSDRLGLFGEKRLRLYRLQSDRSRTGHAPFFSAKTRINLWQVPVPELLDLNGDGRDDLVLGYWKGLTKSQVALDVYLADGRGGFETEARTTEFGVKRGDRSFLSFGRDWNGDGRPDLAIVGDGKLRLHPGRAPDRQARRLVSEEPSASIRIVEQSESDPEIEASLSSEGMELESVEVGRGPVTPLDIDGDGRFEAVLVQRDAQGWLLGLITTNGR